MRRRFWLAMAAVAVVCAVFAFLPTLFSEAVIDLRPWSGHLFPKPADPSAFDPRPGAPLGTLVDDHWLVQEIAPRVWALGEPAQDLDNYEYLIVGDERALLIDAGMKAHDIHPVLASLTPLPVTVIPTHLHFDHTNGLVNFPAAALVDLPETRADQKGELVQLKRHEFEWQNPPSFKVAEWIKPGADIDLGGRKVQLLSTPGHTRSSVSFYLPDAKLLFTGDFIYPTTLFVFGPDSSLSDYLATIERLQSTLPADTVLYGAHCCRNDVVGQAPYLSMADLADVRTAIEKIRSGRAEGRGFIIRRFPVNSRMTLLTLYPFGNR